MMTSIVVGASESSPVTGIRADLISAAYNAAEAALRSVKIGQPNWSVTDGVAKVLQEYGGAVKGVEGVSRHLSLDRYVMSHFSISIRNGLSPGKEPAVRFIRGSCSLI